MRTLLDRIPHSVFVAGATFFVAFVVALSNDASLAEQLGSWSTLRPVLVSALVAALVATAGLFKLPPGAAAPAPSPPAKD